jgi:hypothetical protein
MSLLSLHATRQMMRRIGEIASGGRVISNYRRGQGSFDGIGDAARRSSASFYRRRSMAFSRFFAFDYPARDFADATMFRGVGAGFSLTTYGDAGIVITDYDVTIESRHYFGARAAAPAILDARSL